MSRSAIIHTTEFGIIEPVPNDDPDAIIEDEEEEIEEIEEASFSGPPPPSSQPREGDTQRATLIDTDAEYVYDPNHSTGAQQLNHYDRASSKLEYDYVIGDITPKWEIILRKSMYIIQILMVLGAGVISCGAIVAERNGWNFVTDVNVIYGLMEDELIYVPYACGLMSIFTSVIGCIGAKTSDRCGKVMLIIYMGCLGISLILGLASLSQAFSDKLNVYKYAQRQWDEMTLQQERIFEWEHFCCNFQTLDPCCRFTYGEGECINEYVCFEIVRPHLEENFTIIAIAATIHTVYLFVVMFLCMTFLLVLHIRYKWKLKKEKEQQNTEVNHRDSSSDDMVEGQFD